MKQSTTRYLLIFIVSNHQSPFQNTGKLKTPFFSDKTHVHNMKAYPLWYIYSVMHFPDFEDDRVAVFIVPEKGKMVAKSL